MTTWPDGFVRMGATGRVVLVLIFLSLKSKNRRQLPKSRGSAIIAGVGALGGLILLVRAALDHDTGGAIRYAIFLALLAILVVAVSRRRGDV